MKIFYDLCCLTMKGLLFSLSSLQVNGRENVPSSGPLIIVSNHLNLADPPLLGASIPRDIVFMAKEELFHQPGMATVVKLYGAFPVKRNKPDRQALRRSISILEKGGVLGMFPEGKRNPLTGLGQAEPGVALLAAMSHAPILPIGITGTEAVRGFRWILRRPPIRVNIGTPFSLPETNQRLDRITLDSLTDLIMRRIAELLPPSYRGIYANALIKGPSP